VTEETFSCDRCGRQLPKRQMKEAMYERGRERVREQLCPECLDQVMSASGAVRGIVGQEKHAAVHLNDPPAGKG
jgi:hypothetical protein